jgi:polyisoprenyl-phosphate glycosyltransferase
MSPKPLCSIVITVYDEEDNLDPLIRALYTVADKEPCDWEFIFVDDGSRDLTYTVLREIHAKDSRVKVVRLSRNFGSNEALAVGMQLAAGDIAIHMAGDLQDPPEVIHDFLKRWREGYSVVWAVRASRDEALTRRLTTRAFYWLIRRIALPEYPPEGTGSFCLVDRKVIDVFNACHEHNRVTFALIYWSGFAQAMVRYDRPRRRSGVSKWWLSRQIKLSIDAIVGFSVAPVRLISYLGILLTSLGGIVLIGALISWIARVELPPPWSLFTALVVSLSGLQFLGMGILAEYLWRIAEEVRGRPHGVVQEQLGSFSSYNVKPIQVGSGPSLASDTNQVS